MEAVDLWGLAETIKTRESHRLRELDQALSQYMVALRHATVQDTEDILRDVLLLGATYGAQFALQTVLDTLGTEAVLRLA